MAELTFKLTRDTVFKLFFVKYQELLKNLVSQVLGITVDSITEFVIKNPNIPPENLGGKFCRLDINMEVNGQKVNLEVQVDDEGNYPERSLYYWARSYSSALLTGKDYIDLPRTITINIVAFDLFKDTADVHSEFRVLEVERRTELTDKMILHYFELKKLPEITESDEGNVLKLWLALFNANTDEDLSKIAKIGGGIMVQAVQAYKSILASDDLKEIERLREKARFDEISALGNAQRKNSMEIARRMKGKGMDLSTIMEMTKLTADEISRL
jgi:predicted transposase/invertase (TIGR01784 family)